MTEDTEADDTGSGPAPYVSTAPPTGAAAAAREGKKPRKKPDKAHPWRDNIEAIAVSIVTIVLFKYFVVEAYKIPTGSMQPTLMGNSETGIYDRVLVDKLSYHFRDPDRWEVVVFKYPLEQSKNYIKRIVGMPGEDMRIVGGDLQVKPRGAEDDEWRVLRRPRPVQNAQLRRIRTDGDWKTYGRADGAWSITSDADGETITASGTGRVLYPRPVGSIRNRYLDGYPESMAKIISSKMNPGRARKFGQMNVSDVRARFRATADAATREVKFMVHEQDTTFSFRLPGPAAPEGEVARIEVDGYTPAEGEAMSAASEAGLRLRAGEAHEIEVQNLNDLLTLRIDGEEVCTLEVRAAVDNPRAWVDLAVEAPNDSVVQIDDLRLWRDLYYVNTGGLTEWSIPEDSYVVLGDNSQDSADGRDWRLARYRITAGPDEGEEVTGGLRGTPGGSLPQPVDANPKRVRVDGEHLQFFTNELGEQRVDRVEDVVAMKSKHAPFVPRDLVRGRAVLVVWPLARKGVYRLKWVR